MNFILTHGKFGESSIRLVRLVHKGDRQELRDLAVQLLLKGDFERGFTDGETLPLGTEQAIADRVYALAREHLGDEIEAVALERCKHVLRCLPRGTQAEVDIEERLWSRVSVGGRPHNRAFSASGERRLARVIREGESIAVEAGFSDLPILKIMGEADRPSILSGTLSARWRYGWTDVPFGLHWQQVRQVVLETFANHGQGSVQQLLHDMAQAALDQSPAITEMRFSLSVTRHRPAELGRAGLDDDPDLLIPEPGPVGIVEATVLREA